MIIQKGKKIENSVTVCRTGKRYVNNYADRSRTPIASFFNVEIYLHHQYGVIVTEELG